MFAKKLNYKFERVTPISGISFTGVIAIQEDKNGFIWAGGETGVFFYDGMSFKHYQNTGNSGLPSVSILDIINDSDDQLWFATEKGLAFFDSIQDRFCSIDFFYGKFVEQLFEIMDGIFIVLADEKLYLYDKKQKRAELLPRQPERISTFVLSNNKKYMQVQRMV